MKTRHELTARQTGYFKAYKVPRGEKNRGRLKHNLIGQPFGRLRVVSFYGRVSGQPHWRCVCECGGESIVSTWNLKRENPPHARSCGCYRRELMRERQTAALRLLQLVEDGQSS
jgi:hypothetical protein